MWQRILIATDGTETAQIAAEQAIALAALIQAQVFAVFVADPVDFDQDLTDQMVLAGTEALQRLQQVAVAQGLQLQTELKQGEPVTEILAMANAIQAGLIVVAPHHYDFFYHLLIQPSVSDRVIHRAAQSILIVNALPQSTPLAPATSASHT